jgi:hypothetical protein
MKQKSCVTSLFWLQLTIFFTNEGCSGPFKGCFGQKCAFLAQKEPFMGVK